MPIRIDAADIGTARLPGWRVCWVIGPKSLVSAISQSGSFLDGGASHVMQMAALPLLNYERVQQDKRSLQIAFRAKRDHVLERLAKMGLGVKIPPQATFYIWLDLSGLEEPINNGLVGEDGQCSRRDVLIKGETGLLRGAAQGEDDLCSGTVLVSLNRYSLALTAAE